MADIADEQPLEPELEMLLSQLVEAHRNVPSNKRQSFVVTLRMLRPDTVAHPGLPNEQIEARLVDLEMLAREGLLHDSNSRGTPCFDITREGFAYYEKLKRGSGLPIEQIETDIKRYMDAHSFQLEKPFRNSQLPLLNATNHATWTRTRRVT